VILKPICLLACGMAASSVMISSANAGFLDDMFGSSEKPVVPLNLTTQQIIENNTVWSFNNKVPSAWSVVKQGKGSALKQVNGKESALDSQMEPGTLVTPVGKSPFQTPAGVTFTKGGSQMLLTFGSGKTTTQIGLSFKALDVSGQKIANFLKTRAGEPSAAVEAVGGKVFPQGSVAYLPTTQFIDNQFVLPINESFTNAKTPLEIVENFSSVPFCLSYESRPKSQAYGVVFGKADAKKLTGTFNILPVRRDTIFCSPSGEKPVAQGTWEYVKSGTNGAMVLNMPSGIDPRDYGLKVHENGSVKFAFIAPAKGDKIFRPGKFYRKGTTLNQPYYLFNATAAKAITQSLN
jgi:hypothetical protein